MIAASESVPRSLKTWFVIHFVIDMLFAIPMMIAPVWLLELFGWQSIDPILTRMVAAALFGIGIESYLGRNAGIESFRGMLNLKIIWSLGVIIGILVSMLQGTHGRLVIVWGILAIFAAFNVLWIYWRLRLK